MVGRTSGFRLMVMRRLLVDWDCRAVDCIQQNVAIVRGGDCPGDIRLHVGGQRFQMKSTGGHLLMMVVVMVKGFGGGVQIDCRKAARCSG